MNPGCRSSISILPLLRSSTFDATHSPHNDTKPLLLRRNLRLWIFFGLLRPSALALRSLNVISIAVVGALCRLLLRPRGGCRAGVSVPGALMALGAR